MDELFDDLPARFRAPLRQVTSLAATSLWVAPTIAAVSPGRATIATAPAAMAAGMKSSPLTCVPWKAPNTVPGATLR